MSELTNEEKRIEASISHELWTWRDEMIRRAAELYPEDVFPPVEKGQAHRTPDGAAAAMARHVYNLIARDLGERSIELTHDDAESYTP